MEVITPSTAIGLSTLPAQIETRRLKKGFVFNLMLCGQTGLGKSTLVNALFAAPLIHSKGRIDAEEPLRGSTEIVHKSMLLQEGSVQLRLNVIDTPGFGDLVDNENCWEPIVKYVKDQHSSYLRKELTALREKNIVDGRVHCCLYFIAPTGHGLKPIDVVVLKKLAEVVNVVPVIAKSDTLTADERMEFKARIRETLAQQSIRLFPFDGEEEDVDVIQSNMELRDSFLPFAVIGSNTSLTREGRSFLGRAYKWGVVDINDPAHCDFARLRKFLLETHCQELIETTAGVHYEAFRSKQLLALKESSQNRHRHE